MGNKGYDVPGAPGAGAEEVPTRRLAFGLAVALALVVVLATPTTVRPRTQSPSLAIASTGGGSVSMTPPMMVSAPCASGQNAEVEQAADPALGYVYADWMGCQGIAFARSRDDGRSWDAPLHLPLSTGSNGNAWDPAIAVGPDGTVYAAFMRSKNSQYYPFVAVSRDHGASFAYATGLVPPDAKNWGDRDFLTVAPNGTVYLTWDYGPQRTSITYLCAASGSCAFATGDLNAVVQWSTDRGLTWGPIVPINPNFPAGGGDSAPLWVEPSGRIDVLYQGYHITDLTTYAMDPGHTFFSSSVDGGAHWSAPVLVGPGTGTMSLSEWWIDGALGLDAAGNLYATWDTQGATQDVGWLAVSTDHGATWSPAVRATPDSGQAAHIMEVAGAGSGIAYLTYLTNNSSLGWALYLRAYSITKGFLTPPIQVSQGIWGAASVWPGDTTGLTASSATEAVVTWGSAVPIGGQPKSQIFAAVVDFHL